MTLYIGVDIRARQQTVSYLDTEDGVMRQQELYHERDDIRAFCGQFRGEVIVGIEACGYTNWFEKLIEGLGHKLLVGDPAEMPIYCWSCWCTMSFRRCFDIRQRAGSWYGNCAIGTSW